MTSPDLVENVAKAIEKIAETDSGGMMPAWLTNPRECAQAAITAYRTHDDVRTAARGWQPIETAPRGTKIIGWAEAWIDPCEMLIDEAGVAYSPAAGAEVFPQPTCWAHFPSRPEALPKDAVGDAEKESA